MNVLSNNLHLHHHRCHCCYLSCHQDLLKQLQRCIDEKDLLNNLANNILPPRSFDEVANEHITLYNSLLK